MADGWSSLRLDTLAGCRLVIGGYPPFRYDGRGGGGSGSAQLQGGGLRFAAAELAIPPLNSRSTRCLGLPLPPGIAIGIEAHRLEGEWQPATGAIRLDFQASFRFRLQLAGRTLYAPPDLAIRCQLSTGLAQGQRHRAEGRPLGAGGQAQLVGVARVEPTGEPWLDRFLGLPDEALAVLQCRFAPVEALSP